MNVSATTIITRLIMIICWIMLIFSFLFSPYVARYCIKQKSLNIFIWPMILDARLLTEFERETGIKVYVNYYESNEELYSKLQATKGTGYDIIVPTDYMVDYLIRDELIKKIDTTKLPFIKQLQPFLRGNYYDPTNEYSLPYYVTIFGLGINKNYFGGKLPEPSWSLIFDREPGNERICMLDNAREAISLAGYYLYNTIENNASPERLEAIKRLLIKQKSWVELYTSSRTEELLVSGSCPIAVGTNTDIWKASREYPHIEFGFPKEGTFITIDSFVIPKTTDKDEMIYQLINFLYREHVLAHNSSKYGFSSPLKTSASSGNNVFNLTRAQSKQLHFFNTRLSRQQLQNIWLSVKAT